LIFILFINIFLLINKLKMNKDILDKLKNNKITKLDLSCYKIENIDKLGESLKFNSSLTELCLYNNKIENIDKLSESLKFNSSLTYLDLSWNKIENIDILLTNQNKKLRIIY